MDHWFELRKLYFVDAVNRMNSNPVRDLKFEAVVVQIMKFCKENNVTAHTTRKSSLEFRKKIDRLCKS